MAAQRADSLAQIAAESARQTRQSRHSLREQQSAEAGDEGAADRRAHTDQAAPAVGNSHTPGLTGLQQPAAEAAPQERASVAPTAHQPAPAAMSQAAMDHSQLSSPPDPAESALQGGTAEANQLLTMRRPTALQNRPAGTSVQLERSDLQTTPGKSIGPALAQQHHRTCTMCPRLLK